LTGFFFKINSPDRCDGNTSDAYYLAEHTIFEHTDIDGIVGIMVEKLATVLSWQK